MNQIIELLKQVGIFMVCSQTILHFKPQQKYDKYLKLLVGIMVIAQLMSPVLKVFSGEKSVAGVAEGVVAGLPLMQKGTEDGTFDMEQMLGNADVILNKYMDNEIKSRLDNEPNIDNHTEVGEEEEQ